MSFHAETTLSAWHMEGSNYVDVMLGRKWELNPDQQPHQQALT